MDEISETNCCICFHELTTENSVFHKIFDCNHSNLTCKSCSIQLEKCPLCRSMKTNEFINISIDELYKEFIYIIESESCKRLEGNNLFLFIVNNKLTKNEYFYEYLLSKNEESKHINNINTVFCEKYVQIFKEKKRNFKYMDSPIWDFTASILMNIYL